MAWSPGEFKKRNGEEQVSLAPLLLRARRNLQSDSGVKAASWSRNAPPPAVPSGTRQPEPKRSFSEDVQVPVCPLCNTPVPVRKGETPDVAVGAHMDRDCQQDSAQQKQKIFTNQCFKAGCRKKEMIRLVCEQCHQNFCLHHRHPLDHQCPGRIWPVSKAGCAAIMRSLQEKNTSPNYQLLQNGCKAKS